MSRIRSIKPDFWTSEQILECSRNARLLFIGLWNFCDDEGRHPFSARQAKAEVFPGDDLREAEVQAMLQELEYAGLIKRYEHETKQFFFVTGWKHQRIDKPQPPKYPDPFAENSRIIQGTLPPDRIGEDGKGEERKGCVSAVACASAAVQVLDLGASGPSSIARLVAAAVAPKLFEDFWSAYPRRDGANPKEPARKMFLAAVKGGESPDAIIAAAQAYGDELRRTGKFGTQYVARAKTWLSEKRWIDYQPPPDDAEKRAAMDAFMLSKGLKWNGGKWTNISEAA